MPSIAHHPSFWSGWQVPTEQVEIDWSHRLAKGLIGCYLPGGASGFVDLAGVGPAIGANATVATAGPLVPSPIGPGLSSLAASPGAVSAVRPTQYELNTNIAMVHFGWHTATSGSNTGAASTTPFMAMIRLGNASPYLSWDFGINGTAGSQGLSFYYNRGGGFSTIDTSVLANLGVNCMGCTFGTGGGSTISFYKNGPLVSGPTALNAGAFGYYADNLLCVGGILNNANRFGNFVTLALYLWNTGAAQMLAADMAWIAREPYIFLKPVARRTYGFLQGIPLVAATGALIEANPRLSRRRLILPGDG